MCLKPYTFLVVLTISFLLVIHKANAQESLNEKDIKVALRMVGHQVLLSSNDSTSQVLPIIKEGESYRIQFESDFEFKPNDLVASVERVVKDTNLASSYILEVEQCESKKIVYSFKMDGQRQFNIIPCGPRKQAKACYTIIFSILKRTTDLSLLAVDANSPIKADSKISPLIYISTAAILLFCTAVLFFFWKRKKASSKDPNLIPLGEYHFDKRNTELLINPQKIELTSKEADLLLLLYNTANTTVEREVILNKVWGDQGDYVGRTLDVFISKLRKKLEADSSVKITNIRGVGYKLVMEV